MEDPDILKQKLKPALLPLKFHINQHDVFALINRRDIAVSNGC